MNVHLLLALAPTFLISAAPPEGADPAASWAALEQRVRSSGAALPATPPAAIRVRTSSLPAGHAGRSVPGLIELRPGGAALAHELAHQLLFWACPAASDDALFHEAFALAATGETAQWSEGPYLSLTQAVRVLELRDIDSAAAHRALARVLIEAGQAGSGLPRSIARRLSACAAGARFTKVTAEELAEAEGDTFGEAQVVLNRHSGEVLIAEGEVRRALPFGSVLKPFLIAAAGQTPLLNVRSGTPEWACGESLPAAMGADQALLRSCNGWFLDWAARDPQAASFGAYGPLLLKLGLPRLPASMAEAAGLEPSLSMSPWSIAQAYRALADARPELLAVLARNSREGTLSNLPESAALEGVALKTGTVRDARSRPRLGWIAAITDDLVAVRVQGGKMPRQQATALVALLQRARALPALRAAWVQVFGLLPEDSPEARCPGVGLVLEPGGPRLVEGFQRLRELTRAGAALCLAEPWRVRFPGTPDSGRPYAGSFTFSSPGAGQAAPGLPRNQHQRRARRGSDYLFRTSLQSYAAGVAQAEADTLHGEPRAALLRVIAHDEAESRHPGRPVCDTTHCQVFRGTAPLLAGDAAALAQRALPWPGWLLFSAGGAAPWAESRPLGEVEAALGGSASGLRFDQGQAWVTALRDQGEGPYEVARASPCEPLRSALKLPACPEVAFVEGDLVRFSGRGRGHGQGLDVTAAGQSGLDQDELLRRAYGAVGSGP